MAEGPEDRIARLEAEQRRLRERLAELEARLAAEARPSASAAPAPGTGWLVVPDDAPWPASAPQATGAQEPATPSRPAGPAMAAAPRAEPSSASTAAARPLRQEAADAEGLEFRLGAEWLPRIGIALFVLGVAFFLKLAFDNGWVPLWTHPLLGAALGAGLWLLGDVLHGRDRYGAFPQILAGGGAVIVAFAVYAAHHFPAYEAATGIGRLPGSVLLGSVVLVFAAYAVWRDLPVLASVAAALAPLTAVVADLWSAFSVAYLVLTTAAVLAAAWWRRWPWVPAVALPAAYTGLTVGTLQGAPGAAVLVADAGLTLAFLLSTWRTNAPWGLGNLPAAALVAWVLLATGGPALATVVVLGVLAGAAFLLAERQGRPFGSVAAVVPFSVVALVALATGTEVLGTLTVSTLALLAATGAAGRRRASTAYEALGPGVAVALGNVVAVLAFAQGAPAWASLMAVAGLVAAVAGLGVWRREPVLVAVAVLVAWPSLSALLVLGAPAYAVMAVVAAAMAGFLAWGRAGPEDRAVTAPVQALALVGGWAVVQLALFQADPAWPAAGILPGGWHGLATFAAAAVGAVLATGGPRAHRWAWGLSAYALLLAWPPIQFDGRVTVVLWAAMAVVGAFVAWRPVLVTALSATAAGLAALHLIVIEVPRIAPVPGPAGPVLLDIVAFGAAVVALALLVPQARRAGLGEETTWVGLAMSVGLGLLYLGFALDGGAIPLAWSAVAATLLTVGLARHRLPLRVAGLATIGLVLGRVLLIDLQGVEPVWRILVFLGVGALLLVLSFLYARARRGRPAPATRA